VGDQNSAAAFDWLDDQARSRVEAGLRRRIVVRQVGDAVLDLASNDYLGLARDPRLATAAAAAAGTWGTGATGSRLVTGTTDLHRELEVALASFVGCDRALVFSSGYLANLGAVCALTGPGSLVVSDAHNHASLVDACRLSRARIVVVPHRDVDAVRSALATRPEQRALVLTDAVFSVDGETAPLAELAQACRTHGAALLVDDAHALGVLGPGGRGLSAGTGLAGEPDVVITVTLSKSLGAQGGAVLGPAAVIAHLVDAARPFIFDTGLAPVSAAAALAGLTALREDPGLAERAQEVSGRLYERAVRAGLDARPPEAAVIGIRIGTPDAAIAASAAALDRGVRVGCFRPPSVADGISRLRITARADLDDQDLERAVPAFEAAAIAAAVTASRSGLVRPEGPALTTSG
jgi:8-amino-7-oxononanoate synthase